MVSKSYIPHALAALLTWLNNFENCLTLHYQRLGITQNALNDVNSEIAGYRTAYNKAEHSNAGKADRLDRREKAAAVSKFIRVFVNIHLRYNPAVTDDDRVNLGLNVRDATPTPSHRPETWPVVSVRITGPRQVRICWHDSDSASRAKPAGVHGVEIRHAILDAPPAKNDDLLRSDFSTRASRTFDFDESERAKTVYFILRWESTRGERGPWSEIVNAIIP
jgi:hypothetical protein